MSKVDPRGAMNIDDGAPRRTPCLNIHRRNLGYAYTIASEDVCECPEDSEVHRELCVQVPGKTDAYPRMGAFYGMAMLRKLSQDLVESR